MDDLISRQALMKEFSDFVRASNSSDFAQTPTWNDAVSLVGSMPSAQQWIPCSERLPTTKDDYIITVKEKSLTWTDYVEWSADYHWWEYDDDMVVAWMPLPEPYKGEES